ncbi:TRAP transporter small permease subunit [Ruegeria marina]|uniref:TRAP transporter small permease protein n=1 Tax=Ruegeria marina TaxID=639004 RepID=A0A1G6ZRJ6_9RHOB|nr:TRAP transporter small permease subunit [Ruegeria marina]SDE04465.1 TRAP-type mannitol/chloroaromatic compound transport system, small permease component [Ruegeria marina]
MHEEETVIGGDEPSVAINDPGEIDRGEHGRGDRFVVNLSNVVAWLFPILMIAICAQVVLRQAGNNQAWLDDFQWWLYGAAVLVGVAYAVTTNSHVRVDIFYDNFDPRRKARIDVFALAWCFLPFVILSWDVTLGYAISSVVADEGSDSPNGLHNLWILKVVLNLSFVLIAMATWSMYKRRLKVLTAPTLGRKLLYALPSTMFAINLAAYYAIYVYHWLTLPEGENPRAIARKPIFDEFEAGPWDIKYTIVITVVLTIVVVGLALLRDARRAR